MWDSPLQGNQTPGKSGCVVNLPLPGVSAPFQSLTPNKDSHLLLQRQHQARA